MYELSENISGYICDVFGEEFKDNYQAYIKKDYIPHIRISTRVKDEEKLVESLDAYGIKLEKVESVQRAYRVVGGLELIGKTVELTIGLYYIQSLSSMIPPYILNPKTDEKTLDLCAAPGSKSTQLAEIMGNRGTLYVNEPSVNRIKSLVHNLEKMSITNIGVIKQKGEVLSKFMENTFDRILVDAPCSALGIMQKKGEVSNWWKLSQAEKIAELQLRILISAIKMLKVGGELVYSTCTLTVEENEMVITKVLKNYPVEVLEIELPIKSHNGFTSYKDEELNPEVAKTRRIIPWENNSEGFFITKLKKIDETAPTRKGEVRERGIKLFASNKKEVKKYVNDVAEHYGIDPEILDGYKYLLKGKDIYFINSEWETNNCDMFQRIGGKFANIDKNNNAHLNGQAAQMLEDHIKKNIFELTEKKHLETYLGGGTIKEIKLEYGQLAIKHGDYILGTALALNDGLKSQFPRSKRTHDIIFAE